METSFEILIEEEGDAGSGKLNCLRLMKILSILTVYEEQEENQKQDRKGVIRQDSETKNYKSNQKPINKMTISTYQYITLNENGLNLPTKRHSMTE